MATRQKTALVLGSTFLGGCTADLGVAGSIGSEEHGDTGGLSGRPGESTTDSDGNGDGDAALADSSVVSRHGLAARLSKIEYTNSIQDVLGVTLLPEELDASEGGIPDDTGDGVFKHLADNQTSVEQHALSYFEVAEKAVERVDVAGLLRRLSVCGETSESCGVALIEAVGQRLYRRPLLDREIQAMLTVYTAARAEDSDYEEAARWTLLALLQAPQFLFRMEDETKGTKGEPRELDGYELAARLAAFLWVSVPDDILLEKAADGTLKTVGGLENEVVRMLEEPKAKRFTEVFAIDFSRARFSSFEGATDADRLALNEAVVATFQDHFWDQQGGIADLFSTTRFMVNATAAGLLGIPADQPGLWAVDVTDLPHRVGVMTHPAMIAGMGDREIGSFVNRGKYLMERLLCRHPTAFPASITTEIEQFNADTTGLSEHERAELRMGRPECWNCHQQFEPLAFGFSRFDGAGRYVGEVDAEGKALPLDGWVPTRESELPEYSDIESYMEILATNPVVQTCMTEHFIDFATSRIADDVGRAEARRVGEVYLQAGATLPAMVLAVVQSPLFSTVLPTDEGSDP